MCGRYAASARNADLVEEFGIEEDQTGVPSRSILVNPQEPPAGEPDFNMAPSKQARVVVTRVSRAGTAHGGSAAPEPTRRLRLLTWGL
ncbi:MAG TPA: SOS response-associated peptidase family protein, partial [Candidatus Lustribacter sp.]|nr:SOS response-associated peptidase family protein [Candidatus Lustribacter sp.]